MKKQKDKTYLFVDGSNLYAGQYELFGPKKYLPFAKLIANVEKALETKITHTFFYASYSPRQKSPSKKQVLYLKNEALFYKNVKKAKSLTFFKGYRSPTSGKEKGVDIHLGIDMVINAFQNKCDTVILVSGDADFIYAIETVKQLGATVYSVFLCNRFSLDISYKSTSSLVLDYNRRFRKNKRGTLPKSLIIVNL